ncbi:hypothetical protein OOK29_25825 [Streptomyces phaeochromogenes]|uniref:zinc finger domain-containing protein n=1 Tax=Streptomyces phaeochromogenes TaxID=1923 RepID=UPI0022531D9F|nr:hypothetical protein [Streptomyces phaeochromogenes]MCX5601573.1 hypothetical protein [Streptomyces phaeochromogenes]
MTSRAQLRLPQIEMRCSWCQASPGDPCTNQRGNRARRTDTHTARRDLWVIATTACPDCQAPAGTGCSAANGLPLTGVHPQREKSAADEHARAVEESSRNVQGRAERPR